MRPERTRVKICGLTRPEDALAAAAAGADALGFIHYPPSPRHLDLLSPPLWLRSLPPLLSRVAVLVDPSPEFLETLATTGLFDTVQLHGSETPGLIGLAKQLRFRVIKAFRPDSPAAWDALAASPADAVLADTPSPDGRLGGTGLTGNWDLAASFTNRHPSKPLILSGGLNPANAAAAIRQVRPFAVDVSSGVETAPGVKDPAAVRAFCAAVRQADATH